MRVIISNMDHLTLGDIEWPQEMPLPRIGETVCIPLKEKIAQMYVWAVTHYPQGGEGLDVPHIDITATNTPHPNTPQWV